MSKHIILSRDASGDWYTRAQSFLADNNKHPLEFILTDDNPAHNAFLNAVSALITNTGDTITIDPKAAIVVVTAQDEVKAAQDVERRMDRCQCQCGISGSCGGGGGGH